MIAVKIEPNGKPYLVGNVLIVGQKEDLLTDVPSKYYALLAIDMV